MELRKYDYIDALRGWAIILVLLVHIIDVNITNSSVLLIRDFGGRGVQLFYIISAFTLFMSLHARAQHDKHPFIYFFIRRFFRIAPLFYACIIGYLISFYLGLRAPSFSISIQEVIANFTFTNGFHPNRINNIVVGGRSVATEMIFYITIPLLYVAITSFKRSIMWIIGSLSISIPLVYYLQHNPVFSHIIDWNYYLFIFLPAQFPVFLLGIGLYYIIDKKIKIHATRFRLITTILMILTYYLVMYYGNIRFSSENRPQGLVMNYNILVYMISLFFVASIYYLSHHKVIFFINRITIFMGKISYSVYLLHFIVLFFVQKILTMAHITGLLYHTLFVICTLGISILVAYISYKYIEIPGQQIGKILIERINKKS